MKSEATTLGHRVEVVRSGDWWAITVPALRGVFSQTRNLDEVPEVAREAIALMLDVDPAEVGPIDVSVQPQQGEAELLAE
ncbi:hypothetical protein [Candidatus Poriferisodalis multihospitum]|uniref:type II toxin-antitoxin system HicB family antitoxin n=1 Tax=Candidatus Poriferisodalis multihospitum TaxID=2983191 RepID=UPI002B25DBCA|nr:hypothetical protein [Candidatus Poriferisodalis multihospitum]